MAGKTHAMHGRDHRPGGADPIPGFAGCPIRTGSPYALEVWKDKPLAYWQCQDDYGMPLDSSGNELHMNRISFRSLIYRQAGALTYECDKSIGSAEGESCYRYQPPISTVVDNFTFEEWVYVSGAIPFDISLWRLGAIGVGFQVKFTTDGTFRYESNNTDFGAKSSVLAANTWSHIAVVRNAGTWTYYVNGKVDVANAGTATPSIPTEYSAFQVGPQPSNVAHVAFYESPLSSARIAAHYAAR